MTDPTPPASPQENRPEPPDFGPAEADAPPHDTFEEPPVTESDAANEDRSWVIACHLISLVWLIGLLVLHILGPLGIWYFLRREDREVERHAKEVFNFQVNMLIWHLVGGLCFVTCFLSPVGIILMGAAFVLSLVLPIIAAVKASNGEFYRYPLTYRFL